ncbi:MAG: LPS-assembly protein LptD, partial [Bacteroidaceae bacterium]|nr:LPS-assembly protein LptD [Bacteroidaceae bacterium]MBR4778708.1 LPS-assembly protein LptD [Bacteroidaceae bacterium]
MKRFLLAVTWLLSCTYAVGQEVVRDSLEVARRDSLATVETLSGEKAEEMLAAEALTTEAVAADSLLTDSADAKKKEVVDAPVQYESKDSMVWTKDGNAYLYGSGKVNYQSIELTAERITVNIPKSEVYAEGVKDSTGTETGRPVFKEGQTP